MEDTELAGTVNNTQVLVDVTSVACLEHTGVPSYSVHYSFFWIESSFFLMFQAFLTVQNQASSFVGDAATLALAMLYIGYILSNLLAPVQMSFFGGNPNKAMFFGSMSYTLFVFAFYLALEGHEWVLYPTAIIEGFCGGLIWVGNGVYQTGLSAHSGDAYTEQANIDATTKSTHYTVEYILQGYTLVKTAAISFMNSVQWIVMNANIVVGSIIAYMLVKDGKVKPGTDTMEADKEKSKVLFLVLTGVGVLGNIFFYITWRTAIPCIVSIKQQNPLQQVLKTAKNAFNLSCMKAVYLVCPYFMASQMIISFFFSGFTGTPVKETLGAVNVPLICIVVAGAEVLGALFANPFCKNQKNTRITGIIGTVLLVIYSIQVVIFPYEDWSQDTASGREGQYQWAACIGFGALAGFGDGLQVTAVNTYVSHLVGEMNDLRAPLFSVMQVMKGFGYVAAFLFASLVDFEVGHYFSLALCIISLIGQVIACYSTPGLEGFILPYPPTPEEQITPTGIDINTTNNENLPTPEHTTTLLQNCNDGTSQNTSPQEPTRAPHTEV